MFEIVGDERFLLWAIIILLASSLYTLEQIRKEIHGIAVELEPDD